MVMSALRDFQSSFGAAIRGAAASGIGPVRERQIPLERRMDVYRNNVHASLIDALASAYPVVERLVGTEFFRAMAREFLKVHLPRRGTLTGYGEAFPRYLEGFDPVMSLPYLGDVARVERAWLDSYHAADVDRIDAEALASVPPEELGNLCFSIHPAVQTVSSDFPVWSIWQTNKEEAEPRTVDFEKGGETTLVCRAGNGVEVHLVQRCLAGFVDDLRAGVALGLAVERAMESDAEFDLSAALHLLLSGGALVGVLHEQSLGKTS
jgi:putative DNA-binding protein